MFFGKTYFFFLKGLQKDTFQDKLQNGNVQFLQNLHYFLDAAYSPEAISRASRAPKMGDGGVFGTPCADFFRPAEELEDTCLLKSTFTEASHDRGFKTWQTPATYPECLLWKNVSVGGGLRRMPHGPQHFENNNWQGKGCRRVCRITINIAWPE
jgi:hypothetical protein